MKKLLSKKNLVFIFPFLALVVTIIAVSTNKDLVKPKTIETTYETEISYKRIYAISEDNSLVIPLTATCPVSSNVAEDMLCVLNLLKEDSSVTSNSGFTYTLNKNVKVNAIEIDEKVASIDFSSEFNDYPVTKERKILESLVWTLSQFDEIDGLIIKVNGLALERMPQNNTPLPSLLTKDIGINHYLSDSDPYNTSSITIFYETEINDLTYLVPVTRRIEEKVNQMSSLLETLYMDIDFYTGLKTVSILSSLEINNFIYDPDKIVLDLSDKSLLEELCVYEEIYELLMLTFNELNGYDLVMSLTVDNEPVLVDGYQNYATIDVSDILVNDVEL